MTLIRPLQDQFQDECWSRLCCSACGTPLSPHIVHPWNSPSETPAVWLAPGSWFFGTWVHLLPRIAGFLNKASFLLPNTSFSIGFLSQGQPNLSSVTFPPRTFALAVFSFWNALPIGFHVAGSSFSFQLPHTSLESFPGQPPGDCTAERFRITGLYFLDGTYLRNYCLSPPLENKPHENRILACLVLYRVSFSWTKCLV